MMQNQPMNPGDSLDPALFTFLRDRVNSFTKWDLVRFFHDNPHAADTAENIARYTGRDVVTTERELDSLVETGVLLVETAGKVRVYRLTADERYRRLIDDFVTACHDRDFRVRAIQIVIHGMQFSPRHDF